MKGLIVEILKSKGRSFSNNGLSQNHEECLLVGKGVPEIFEADGLPVVTIVERDLGNGYLTAYPVTGNGSLSLAIDSNTMFGGCFIYSSDSRFRKLATYPVPLHDRKE